MANFTGTVSGGVAIDQQDFTWRLENFLEMSQHTKLIYAQELQFEAGSSIGLPSKWRLFLGTATNPPVKLGIYFQLLEPKCKSAPDQTSWLLRMLGRTSSEAASTSKLDYLIAKCHFKILNGDGTVYTEKKTGTYDMARLDLSKGTGVRDFIEREPVNNDLPLVDGVLTIHCTFQLYAPSSTIRSSDTVAKPSVQELLDQFNKQSSAKAWEDLGGLLKSRIEYNEIKIIAKDGRQFTAKKEVLAARMPAFEAKQVRCDTEEKTTEEVKLENISGPTVDILLHYVYTGKLLPEWRDAEVILELTNAAAKYELPDLLAFLDMTLDKVCQAGNAFDLLALANKLELKTAEVALLDFIRREGLASNGSSAERLFQILNEDADAPPQANGEL